MSLLPEKLHYIIGVLSTGCKTSDNQSSNQSNCSRRTMPHNSQKRVLNSIKHNLDIGYRVRCQGNDL